MKALSASLLDPSLLRPALRDAIVKLDPRSLAKNPVIFITALVSLLASLLFLRDLATGGIGSVINIKTPRPLDRPFCHPG